MANLCEYRIILLLCQDVFYVKYQRYCLWLFAIIFLSINKEDVSKIKVSLAKRSNKSIFPGQNKND